MTDKRGEIKKTKSLHFVSILSVMLIQMENSQYARFFEEESEDEVHPPTPLPFTQPPPPLLDAVLPPTVRRQQ